MKIDIRHPEVFTPLWQPARYKGAKGGRGSGKSHFFATYCVVQMLRGRNVIGIREFQNSIEDSSKRLMEQKIAELSLQHMFTIQDKRIMCASGAVAIFKGMQNYNAASVKSIEGFDVAWWEEAHVASSRSLEMLIPTLRAPGSELLFSWNPEDPKDPIEKLLVHEPPENAIVVTANWNDNPWFPDELREDMERDRERDPDKYAHVWGGEYRGLSEARVFRNWRVDELTPPDNVVWFYGADWGFAQDETAALRCCIPDDHTLYVDAEVYGLGIPTDALPAFLNDLPDARKWPMRGDSARPETIDYVRRHGFPKLIPAKKGKGSVEDGITFLQGMDIVVHPSCANLARELRSYAYKTDPRTGEILPAIEDRNNHLIDALRYAVEGLHRRGKLIAPLVKRPDDRLRRPPDYQGGTWRETAEEWKVV